VRRCELDLTGSGYGTLAGSCDHGNGSSLSLRAGNFLTS
jgi:hypothetical protein